MKNIEQQIDGIIETIKLSLTCGARSAEQVEEIKRQCDSLGHNLKALSAIVNDRDAFNATIHRALALLLSQ